jgi:hypothetical protein
LQNPRPLPHGQPDTRAVLHDHGEDFLRSPEIIAGVKQGIDFLAVPRPFFDLVEITVVRIERVESFFGGQSFITLWGFGRPFNFRTSRQAMLMAMSRASLLLLTVGVKQKTNPRHEAERWREGWLSGQSYAHLLAPTVPLQ